MKERAPRFSVCTRPSLFSAKKIYHVCRGCTRPRDKRGGVCRGKRDWKFCGPASFADDPVFYCVQVKLICSYFLYSTSRRKEQPPFCFLFFISLSPLFFLNFLAIYSNHSKLLLRIVRYDIFEKTLAII